MLSGTAYARPGGVDVEGALSPNPSVGFLLPAKEWSALTRVQQLSLLLYVEDRVQFVRSNPDLFALTPITARLHEREVENIRAIKDGAWFIGTAMSYSDDPEGNLYLDRKIIVGDAAWPTCESPNAIRASQFRKR
ncbi:hypothetical protein DB347_10625 [Opitutaceae bacterium EW11]|nr:hypothetical protein DB347_10625 [Opitutaceae bacterium EW11]